MGKFIDLTSQRFGKLTVVARAPSEMRSRGERVRPITMWFCVCDCGNHCTVDGVNLTSQRTQSCGCHQRELARKFCRDIGAKSGKEKAVYKHGDSVRGRDRLYFVWAAMKQRCKNRRCSGYADYGGRGISICDEWEDYINFRDWAMSNGYDPNAAFAQCTLDRIDVNGNYCPENCRWVTMAVQATNKRNSKSSF